MRSTIGSVHGGRRHTGAHEEATSLWRSTLGVILILALGVLGLPLASDAQPPGQVPRIGYLAADMGSLNAPRLEAFRHGLRDLGYVEGKNLTIEYRFAEGKLERLPELAAELVRLKVEVIVAGGTLMLLAAKHATRTIPIVMTNVSDPVARGLVASLARPGGNITGLTSISMDLSGKRLEQLKETVPGLARVGVLWDPADQGATAVFKETEAAAQALGVQVQPLEVRDPKEVERAFYAATGGRVQALIVVQGLLINARQKQIMAAALERRLPTMYSDREFVESGGLMSYGPNYPAMYRRAATYVHKILQGATPVDLPVEQPTKFELVVNRRTAKALGLEVPTSILLLADEVIE
jgi:putative tryptophan/tyrosine transport system substrate-binding protein